MVRRLEATEHLKRTMDEADREWLHPLYRRVLILPRRELPLEAEVNLSKDVQTRVRLTQSGECLADGPCLRLCSTCTYVAPRGRDGRPEHGGQRSGGWEPDP